MCVLFVDENGSKISTRQNRVEVNVSGIVRSIPIESVDTVNISSGVQITSQCMVALMKRGVPVNFYTNNNQYIGSATSLENVYAERQRQQVKLYDSDFALEWARQVLTAKMKNQKVLLNRTLRFHPCDISEELMLMGYAQKKISRTHSITEMMGCEGYAARNYFSALGKLVDPSFAFSGRSKRPAQDPFNAMLNFGYSVLRNEIEKQVRSRGLNPYFGLIHRDKMNHATLVSDLMEEWRPVIVDSVVMSLCNGHEIFPSHFLCDTENGGVYFSKEGKEIFVRKLENKMNTEIKYLSYTNNKCAFRFCIEQQLDNLIMAMQQENPEIYKPLCIR